MSLLRRLFGLETKASLASPDADLLALFSATPSASGISITPRIALSCAPVRCAVQAISEAVGQLPVHVYRRTGDNGRERDPTHPAYGLLHDQANEWTSASDFREQLTRDCLLSGNAYPITIERSTSTVDDTGAAVKTWNKLAAVKAELAERSSKDERLPDLGQLTRRDHCAWTAACSRD